MSDFQAIREEIKEGVTITLLKEYILENMEVNKAAYRSSLNELLGYAAKYNNEVVVDILQAAGGIDPTPSNLNVFTAYLDTEFQSSRKLRAKLSKRA